MSEGCYPHQFGGVSVWCDQLVRGLPGYEFQLVALVASGAEPVVWTLPENVASVTSMPLWGRPPPARSQRGRAARSQARCPWLPELIDILLAPPDEAQRQFADVLREMFEFAQARSLNAALESEEAARQLFDAWQLRSRRGIGQYRPTVQDAISGMQLIEHSLRPLSHPPVRADLAHVVTNGLSALPALTARWRYGTPVIVTEHGVSIREQYMHVRTMPYRWPVKDLFLRFLRRLCTLAYHEAEVITPGNVYNKRWEEQLGADASRIQTVYNGVNPADFPPLSAEPGVPTITWVGRIDPVKDLETLLLAFSIVQEQLPEARLRIFGSPPHGRESYLRKCQALAAELGLAEAATFEGRVGQIRDAYNAGHVVVLCSVSEGFPYTLIEAMTCGRPCVATDVGGVTEALGEAGLVVPPRSPAELAAACVELLRDRPLRQRLGLASRQRALEFFTLDRAVRAFDELYAALGTGSSVALPEPPGEQLRPGLAPARRADGIVLEAVAG